MDSAADQEDSNVSVRPNKSMTRERQKWKMRFVLKTISENEIRNRRALTRKGRAALTKLSGGKKPAMLLEDPERHEERGADGRF